MDENYKRTLEDSIRLLDSLIDKLNQEREQMKRYSGGDILQNYLSYNNAAINDYKKIKKELKVLLEKARTNSLS